MMLCSYIIPNVYNNLLYLLNFCRFRIECIGTWFSYVALCEKNNSFVWIVISVFYSLQAWKRRWFVLRSGRLSGEPDVLQYYKNQQSRRPIRTINLNLCEQVNA